MIDSNIWRFTAKEPNVFGVHAFAWASLLLALMNPLKISFINMPLFGLFFLITGLSLYGNKKGIPLGTLLNTLRFKIGYFMSYNNTLMNGDPYDECRAIFHI